MNVAQLIEILQSFDPEALVAVNRDDRYVALSAWYHVKPEWVADDPDQDGIYVEASAAPDQPAKWVILIG